MRRRVAQALMSVRRTRTQEAPAVAHPFLARRILASLVALAAVGASGCYLSHPAGDGPDRRDGGPFDAGPRPDGWVQPDGAYDAGRDSGRDSGLDSGFDSG